MNSTIRYSFTWRVLALCTLLVAALAAAGHAATINYGNFPFPPSGMALNVTESSGTDPVPLYGPPQPVPGGLDFDPMNFVAVSNNGGSDFTDGQLNLTIMSPGLTSLNLLEAGDYSLLGVGGLGTQALAGAIIHATVTEINGAAITPIVLAPSNASVGFNLLTNPGFLQPWSLGTGLNIAGQLPAGQRATKVEIQINNQLFASSEAASAAFISKKEFILTGKEVPEPASIAMFALALGVISVTMRRNLSHS